MPKTINFQGLSINDTSFLIKGTQENQISFGINASKVDLQNLTLENILVSYDAEKKQVIANGSVAPSEANKKFTYKGLSFKKISLNALHDKNKWEFKLEGLADINGKEVDYYIDIKDEANKVEYVATLAAQS